MQLEIKEILIKKLNAYTESYLAIKKDKETQVNVNINILLIDSKRMDDGTILFKSSFVLDIIDFGHIDAQLDTIVMPDNQEELLSEWESTDKKLSNINRIQIDNAIFYYMMPLILNITDKMQMPMPIPSLSMKE